jgi:hypothetical protein
MHVSEIEESANAIADEEYVVKRRRIDNFNITESLNVAVSGQCDTPSVVSSTGLRIVAEAFVGFATPWNVNPFVDNSDGEEANDQDEEAAEDVEMHEDNDNDSVYSPTSPAFSPTSPMSTGNGEQEVYGVDESKSETDVIQGLGWNRYGVLVQPTPQRQPWRLSLMDRHNREIFAITPATDNVGVTHPDNDSNDSDAASELGEVDNFLAQVEAEDVMRRLLYEGPHDNLPTFDDIETDPVLKAQLQLEWIRARNQESKNSRATTEHMLPGFEGDGDSSSSDSDSGSEDEQPVNDQELKTTLSYYLLCHCYLELTCSSRGTYG